MKLVPVFLCILIGTGCFGFANPVSESSSFSLISSVSDSAGGPVKSADGSIVADVAVGSAIGGGVSSVTLSGVEEKGGFTGVLSDAVSLSLSSPGGVRVEGGGSLPLSSEIVLDDGTLIQTGVLNWEPLEGPFAGVSSEGLFTAGYPNLSSMVLIRGRFDLLSETIELTVDPLMEDPYSLSLENLGGNGTYRVLFGESPSSLSATTTSDATFAPGSLQFGETYYWQIFDGNNINLTPGGNEPVRLLAGVDLELLKVDDPGNPVGEAGYGAVDRPFYIGSFEVTNRQYADFLNAVAASDQNGLFETVMFTNPRGGIERFGIDGFHTYAPKEGMGEKPVNFLSFWSACRFCNWLHNGLPTGVQSAATTEDGAYDLTDANAVANNTVLREADARYHIPNHDEWDKSAYYDPRVNAEGGAPGDDFYWLYPTLSDTPPTEATADTDGNIDNDSDPIANFNSFADWNSQDGNVTTVGSGGVGSTSFYGASDMAGNVREMLESIEGSNRISRGGDYGSMAAALASSDSIGGRLFGPDDFASTTGFRVAALFVPEPPRADPAKVALRLSLTRKVKKLKKQLKRVRKLKNSGKTKKIRKKLRSFTKRLRALG